MAEEAKLFNYPFPYLYDEVSSCVPAANYCQFICAFYYYYFFKIHFLWLAEIYINLGF